MLPRMEERRRRRKEKDADSAERGRKEQLTMADGEFLLLLRRVSQQDSGPKVS